MMGEHPESTKQAGIIAIYSCPLFDLAQLRLFYHDMSIENWYNHKTKMQRWAWVFAHAVSILTAWAQKAVPTLPGYQAKLLSG